MRIFCEHFINTSARRILGAFRCDIDHVDLLWPLSFYLPTTDASYCEVARDTAVFGSGQCICLRTHSGIVETEAPAGVTSSYSFMPVSSMLNGAAIVECGGSTRLCIPPMKKRPARIATAICLGISK